METHHDTFYCKKVVGQRLSTFVPVALHFLLSSSFLCSCYSFCLYRRQKGKFCFSCMPEFRDHFLQKSPISHTASCQEFYLLMVSYSCNYPCPFCITQILFVHLLVSQNDTFPEDHDYVLPLFKFLAPKMKSGKLEGLKNVELH